MAANNSGGGGITVRRGIVRRSGSFCYGEDEQVHFNQQQQQQQKQQQQQQQQRGIRRFSLPNVFIPEVAVSPAVLCGTPGSQHSDANTVTFSDGVIRVFASPDRKKKVKGGGYLGQNEEDADAEEIAEEAAATGNEYDEEDVGSGSGYEEGDDGDGDEDDDDEEEEEDEVETEMLKLGENHPRRSKKKKIKTTKTLTVAVSKQQVMLEPGPADPSSPLLCPRTPVALSVTTSRKRQGFVAPIDLSLIQSNVFRKEEDDGKGFVHEDIDSKDPSPCTHHHIQSSCENGEQILCMDRVVAFHHVPDVFIASDYHHGGTVGSGAVAVGGIATEPSRRSGERRVNRLASWPNVENVFNRITKIISDNLV